MTFFQSHDRSFCDPGVTTNDFFLLNIFDFSLKFYFCVMYKKSLKIYEPIFSANAYTDAKPPIISIGVDSTKSRFSRAARRNVVHSLHQNFSASWTVN
jgi:hypothetical protein